MTGLVLWQNCSKKTTTSFCWKNSIVHALAHLKVSVVQGNTVNAECENQQQICHQLVWHLTCVFHLFLQGRRQIFFLAVISTGKIFKLIMKRTYQETGNSLNVWSKWHFHSLIIVFVSQLILMRVFLSFIYKLNLPNFSPCVMHKSIYWLLCMCSWDSCLSTNFSPK